MTSSGCPPADRSGGAVDEEARELLHADAHEPHAPPGLGQRRLALGPAPSPGLSPGPDPGPGSDTGASPGSDTGPSDPNTGPSPGPDADLEALLTEQDRTPANSSATTTPKES